MFKTMPIITCIDIYTHIFFVNVYTCITLISNKSLECPYMVLNQSDCKADTRGNFLSNVAVNGQPGETRGP